MKKIANFCHLGAIFRHRKATFWHTAANPPSAFTLVTLPHGAINLKSNALIIVYKTAKERLVEL